MTKNKIIIASISSVVVLAAVGAGLYYLKPWQAPIPEFSFNAQQAPGWWGGTNGNTQASVTEDYAGDTPREKLAVAYTTILHGEGEGKSAPDNCFLMYSYYDYHPESLSGEYEAYEKAKIAFGDTTLTRVSTSQQRITTFEGERSYELRQYEFGGESVKDSLKGYETGFVEMDNGYIRIEGVCATANALSETLAVLPSIQLKR